jgi:hypothetical protein
MTWEAFTDAPISHGRGLSRKCEDRLEIPFLWSNEELNIKEANCYG